MLAWREFWSRFRSGVPGAPARPGVPADRLAELEAELAPIFAALERPQQDADALVAQAKAEAEHRRSVAREQARSIVAEAQANAAAEQSRAASARLAQAESERLAIVGAAHAEAARIDLLARERLPTMISALVDRLLEQPR